MGRVNAKCSLSQLQHPGTKIAPYIILNEKDSPLSGPGVESDLSACFLGGRKDMQSKEHLHWGKRVTEEETNTDATSTTTTVHSFRWADSVPRCKSS